MALWRPRTRSKYPVAPKAERTLDGRTYHSKLECKRAGQLTLLLLAGEIDKWMPQVTVELVKGFETTVDFEVWENGTMRYEEVKGHERQRFRDVRRLWAHHGPAPLWIYKAGGSCWDIEVLPAASQERANG